MNPISRRRFVLSSTALAGLAALPSRSEPLAPAAEGDARTLARDEAHWKTVAQSYETNTRITNLENGNWGLMARPVMDEYRLNTEKVNRENSYYARRQYDGDLQGVRALVGKELGAGAGEIALTRGATEALQNIIGGFNLLRAGDSVMYADLDYHSVQIMMDSLARRHRAEVVRLEIPEPADYDGLVRFYADAMDRHPRTRLLLLTHLSHRTGLVVPVAPICREARKRGIRVVVDAAHSWGQLPFKVADLDADYAGFNLHKWMGAPVGVGVMYIRQGRLEEIDPNMCATPGESAHIEGRVHSGTSNFAAFLTVPRALAFHHSVGGENKAARLKYLRDLWVAEARKLKNVEVLTPDDPHLHAGMTSFRITGRTSPEANKSLAARLLEEFSIFTVQRDGVAKGACVRITPALYNSADDIGKFVTALRAVAG